MKAVILAGGKGSRLKEHTAEIPKPLIRIEGKPVLQYQIESLAKSGIRDILLSIGYLGDRIIEYFGDGSSFGVNINYLEEASPLGTGGVIHLLKEKLDEDFIFLYGDIVLNVDWQKIKDFHYINKGIATALIHPNDHPFDSDLVIMDQGCRISGISYKNSPRQYYSNLVNAGIYLLSSKILSYSVCGKADFEKDILSRVLSEGRPVYGYRTPEYVKDMGTETRLARIREDIRNGLPEKKALYNKQKCVFLDRDGTVNKLTGLLSKPDELELEAGAAEAVKLINSSGCLCIVITNQPVVARNLCTLDELGSIHQRLETLLGNEGAYLDDLFFCPHHPDRGYPDENREYKIKCSCRKPASGLILAAAEKYNISLPDSFFIGDTTVDIQTGKNAGIKTVLLETGEAGKDGKFNAEPDLKAKNLYSAVKMILEELE